MEGESRVGGKGGRGWQGGWGVDRKDGRCVGGKECMKCSDSDTYIQYSILVGTVLVHHQTNSILSPWHTCVTGIGPGVTFLTDCLSCVILVLSLRTQRTIKTTFLTAYTHLYV